MLFESLDKIKRNSIFTAIILMALGVVMLLCPEGYIVSFTLGTGYLLVIISKIRKSPPLRGVVCSQGGANHSG